MVSSNHLMKAGNTFMLTSNELMVRLRSLIKGFDSLMALSKYVMES